jgi:hypothetical protein
MKQVGKLSAIFFLAMLFGCSEDNSFEKQNRLSAIDTQVLTANEARTIAKEAYIFGFPFVANYRAFISRLVEKDPLMEGADFNQFAHNRDLFPPQTADTTQRDTLFSLGILDLRREPMVISVPDVPKGEVYMLQMGSTSTETLPYISTRTTNNKAGNFVVVGPEFQGYLPTDKFDGVITTRGQIVVMLGRTVVTDVDDLTAPRAIQSGMKMQAMSQFVGTKAPTKPAPLKFLPWDDKKAQGIDVFDYINMALAWHPAAMSELAPMARFSRIGVVPGRAFSAHSLSDDVIAAIEQGITEAKAEINAVIEKPAKTVGNWMWDTSDISRFGSDYLFRAAISLKNIYPNAPDHAVYGQVANYPDGQALTGEQGAQIRFEAGKLPPADWFWSLTLYDAETTAMYPNDIQRYNVGNKTKGLTMGYDGSLTIYIQHKRPTEAAEHSNWLPAPKGKIYMVLRLYGAKPEVIDGNWTPPLVTKKE